MKKRVTTLYFSISPDDRCGIGVSGSLEFDDDENAVKFQEALQLANGSIYVSMGHRDEVFTGYLPGREPKNERYQ